MKQVTKIRLIKAWLIKTIVGYATASAGRKPQTPLIHREGQALVFIDKGVTSAQKGAFGNGESII
jgi:hypothetical protein